MTIQKKTALIFTGFTATILLLLSFTAYFFMNVFAFQDYYKRLEIRGIISAKAQLEEHHGQLRAIYNDIREKHLEPMPEEKEFFFPSDSLSVFIKSSIAANLPGSFFTNLKAKKTANYKTGNYFYTGIVYTSGSRDYIVIVSAQNAESVKYTRILKRILAGCWMGGILLAYTSGLFFSRHTFKPVRQIIDKVKTIGVENLHLRLEDRKDNDEVAVLASTFNNMLSRLETSFETQNNFVSNASHELRTPLTAIYGEAEIALSRQRNEDEYRQSLEIILAQAEKLQHLTDSLLNLAQTGFDGKKQNMTPIRIDELLVEVKNTINNLIPNNKIQIDLGELPISEDNLMINGSYNLLKLGLSNVMENACKYSENEVVTVKLTSENGKLSITVKDKGIGIPEEELKYIYDPFFRASNTGNYKGYGIGLPLTRNIIRLHKGEIKVQSKVKGGTTVILSLPIAE